MPEEREQDIGKDITQDTPTDAPGNIVNVEDPLMPTAKGLTAKALPKVNLNVQNGGVETPATRDNEKISRGDEARPNYAAGRNLHDYVEISSAGINTALIATIDAAKGLGKKASEVVEEMIERVEDAIGEGNVGPYESPSTCAQSDLDPLAGCVKAGVDLRGGDVVGQS